MKHFQIFLFSVFVLFGLSVPSIDAYIYKASYLVNRKTGKKVISLRDSHEISSQGQAKDVCEGTRKLLIKSKVRVLVEGYRGAQEGLELYGDIISHCIDRDDDICSLYSVQKFCGNICQTDDIDLRPICIDFNNMTKQLFGKKFPALSQVQYFGKSCEFMLHSYKKFFERKFHGTLSSFVNEVQGELKKSLCYNFLQTVVMENRDEKNNLERWKKIGEYMDENTICKKIMNYESILFFGQDQKMNKDGAFRADILDKARIYFGVFSKFHLMFPEIEALNKILNGKEEYFIVYMGGMHSGNLENELVNELGYEKVNIVEDVRKCKCQFSNCGCGLELDVKDYFQKILMKEEELAKKFRGVGLIAGGVAVTIFIICGLHWYFKKK